jgi:hypothetical protein
LNTFAAGVFRAGNCDLPVAFAVSRNMTALTEDELTDAIGRIRELDRDLDDGLHLGDALERYRSALRMQVPNLFCVIDTYPFGQRMFDAGKPLRSKSSEKFEAPLHQESGFPLGIILNGYAEVTAYVYGAGVPRAASQAVLKPGGFIGSFEFMDWLAGVEPKGIPDWMITAGAASIRCAFSTNNNSFVKHLVRLFPDQRINGHAIRTTSPFLEQMKIIEPIQNYFEKFRTDVMYFGNNWFQPVQDDDAIRAARSVLMEVIGRRTWRASARIMPPASRAAEFFFRSASGGIGKFTRPEQHERLRAINVFNSLYDLYSGRRPVFVPERRNGEWGPTQEICNALRGYNDDENPVILRPDYLSGEHPVGFMPVESIGSDLVEGGGAHESALMNSLHTIDQAANAAAREGRSILEEYDKIIRALSVRLPAEKKDQTMGVKTCDVRRNPRGSVILAPMQEAQFFGPDISLSRPGAEFFKTCIRLIRAT